MRGPASNLQRSGVTQASEQLIALLGHAFDGKAIRDVLAGWEVKRVAEPNSPLSESIVWIPKASVRIDVYRPQQLSKLTAAACAAQPDDWLIGSVELLAPGSDNRIKAPFPGLLPQGLSMQSTPQACIDAYGEPDLDEEHERPGFSGRVLAWRLPTTNRAITFAGLGDDGTMLSYTACLIGCIGAWRSTQPEIFAP